MSAAQRAEVLAEAGERLERYDPRHWRLRQRIEQLDAAAGDPETDAAAVKGRRRERVPATPSATAAMLTPNRKDRP